MVSMPTEGCDTIILSLVMNQEWKFAISIALQLTYVLCTLMFLNRIQVQAVLQLIFH
jgi:hypothetical protein